MPEWKESKIDYVQDPHTGNIAVLAVWESDSGLVKADQIGIVALTHQEDPAFQALAPISFALMSKIIYDVDKIRNIDSPEPDQYLVDCNAFAVHIPYDYSLSPEELN